MSEKIGRPKLVDGQNSVNMSFVGTPQLQFAIRNEAKAKGVSQSEVIRRCMSIGLKHFEWEGGK